MTSLQKLAALGHERANRILAVKVMGWVYNEEWDTLESKDFCPFPMRGFSQFGNSFRPCTDLNHAKMVVDKLTEKQYIKFCRIITNSIFNCDVYASINASADARMAAVMEALDLWPKGESK